YANRLAAPTPWTRSATRHFRTTSRALARVLASVGPGSGGVLATVRFGLAPEAASLLGETVRSLAGMPRITGIHLCRADDGASNVKTTESKGRADIEAPPESFLLIEACEAGA